MKQHSVDIAALPENERKLYHDIRSRYRLTFDRFEVNGKQLRLLKIADLEEFLGGKDPLANVSEFPFWVRLWDAAKVLAYFLGAQKEVKGQRLLELGAGLGAPGLAAAAAGFTVTLSDYEEIILNFQRISAAASGLREVECVHLDWLAPRELGSFDVLAGAEILFRDTFFEPLLQIFRRYLKPNGTIFLAHEATRKSLPMFLALAEEYFVIATKKQTIRVDGCEKTIVLNRLQPKN